MTERLRLATRKSMLALAQARAYARALQACWPGLLIDEVHVVTSGDRFVDRPLQALGGKGLFIKEIEEALLEGRADIAVHSIKDVPAELAEGLTLAAIPPREDPHDVLVTRDGGGLADLPRGAVVGTSSLRRRSCLLEARPDLDVRPLRGNVDTRLRKLDEGEVHAVVLAYAGLRRLGIDRAVEVLDAVLCLPAVGQGALGIECRSGDARTREVLAASNDRHTEICVTAERAFMKAVGGSCQLPVAAHCTLSGEALWLRGLLADEDGSNVRRGERRATWSGDLEACEVLGRELGETLAP